MGVFPQEGSVRIGRRRLYHAMARVRVLSTAVLTLGAFPRLFLPCLRLLAMVGAVVLTGSSVGV